MMKIVLSQAMSSNLRGNFFLALILVFGLPGPFAAAQQTILYTNGENNATPITITAPLNPTTLEVDNSDSATQSGTISDSGTSGAIIKDGTGTLTLTVANYYSGATTINAGTLALAVNGSISGSSGVDLAASGATFDISNAGNGQTIQGLTGTSGTTVNLGGQGLTVNPANSTEFDGSITGDGDLAKAGSGTLTLTGTSTLFTLGAVGGTLAIADGGHVSASSTSGIGNASGNGIVTVDGTGSIWTNSGGIILGEGRSASGTLTISNGGTVNTGLVTIAYRLANEGTVNLNSDGVLVANEIEYGGGTGGAAFNFNGGTLRANESNSNFIANFTGTEVNLESGGGTIDNNGYAITINSPLTGTGSATFIGSGTTELTGTNTYTGGTTITDGILEVSSPSNLGTGAVTLGGGELLTTANATFTENVTLNSGTTNTLAAAANTTATYSGVISDATTLGALTIGDGTNNGTVVLSGSNTYTGGTTISSGVLEAANNSALGTGTVTVDSGASLQLNGGNGNITVTNAITLSGTGAGGAGAIFNSEGDQDTVSGNITLAGDASIISTANGLGFGGLTLSGTVSLGTHDLTLAGNNDAEIALSGQITGSGGLIVTGSAGGVILAPSTSNTYTGTTTVESGANLYLAGAPNATAVSGALLEIDGGTVYDQSTGQLASSSVLTLTNGGKFEFAGNESETETIAGLNGDAGTSLANDSGTSAALILNETGTNTYTFAGNINDDNNSFSLTKEGTGTQILSGNNNYVGGTTITGGILEISSENNIGGSGNAGGLTLGGGELLTTANATFTEGVTLNAGNTNTLAAAANTTATYSGVISDATTLGALTINDGTNNGTVVLSGANAYTGGTIINGGTLAIGSGGSISSSSGVNLAASGATFDISGGGNQTIQDLTGTGGSTVNLGSNFLFVGTTNSTEFDGSIMGSGAFLKEGSGTLTLTGTSSFGLLSVSGGGSVAISQGGQVTNTSGVSGSDVTDGSVTVEGTGSTWTDNKGIILGTTGGSGTLTISNGGTVSAGTVSMANGTISGGTLNLDSGGLLETGAVVYKGGSGGAAFNFNGGTLQATAASSGFISSFTGTEVSILSGGGTIDNNGYAITINSPLTGTGAATFTGSGTTTLNGTNTYTGGTTLEAGTLVIGNSSALGTGALTTIDPTVVYVNGDNVANPIVMEGDTTLEVDNTDSATQSGDISQSGGSYAITKTGSGTLTLSGSNAYTGGTTISGGTLAVSGNSATINSPGATTYVGYNGGDNATLVISNGGTVTNSVGYIGYDLGSTGSVTVTGTGSTWTSSGDLLVGHDGTGTLLVSAGGTVKDDTGYIGDNSDSTGNNSVTVTGTDSTWTNNRNLIVGHNGAGTLTVSAGGAVSDGAGYIGNDSTSTGTVTVTGTGSTWTNSSNLYVGDANTGTLMVAAGGTVKDSVGYVGYNSGITGHVTVTGTDSTWMHSSNLVVGYNGTGTLTVSAGGTVSNRTGYIGNNQGSTGTVTVTGAGSTWTNSSNIYVGDSGTGTLTVSDSATATATNVYVSHTSTGEGTLNLESGGVLITGQVAVPNGTEGAYLNFDGGTLRATGANAAFISNFTGTEVNLESGGGTIDNNGYAITITSPLTGVGAATFLGTGTTTLAGTDTYSGGTTISAGTLVAANANALGTGLVNQGGGTLETNNVNHVITMGNGFDQTAGTLVLNLNAAPNAANNDVVNVTGSATLDGNLTINYTAGKLAPLQSETYTVITTTTGITNVNASGYEPPALQAGALQILISGQVVGNDFDVTLTGKQSSFTALTGTNFTVNQQGLASYLDRFDGSPTLTGPVISLLQGLDGVSVNPSALGPYLDQLTPLKFANFTRSTAFNNASFSTQAFDNYLANHRGPDGGFISSNGGIDYSGLTVNNPNVDSGLQTVYSRLLAWNPAPSTGLVSDTPAIDFGGVDMKDTKTLVETSEPANPWNVFVSGNVVLAQDFSDSAAGISHADSTTGAVQAGADYKITPHFLVGAEFAYGHTSSTLDNIGSSASVDTYSPGVYASYSNKGWYANALGSYGFANYNQNRNVAIGAFNGTATSHPGGDQIVGNLDGGYDFHHGPWTFGPTLGAQYVHLDVDGFTESGLPGADLTVNQNETDSLRSSLGGRISYAIKDGGVLFNPHLSASWQHEFLDQSRGVTSQFNGIGAGSFVMATPNPSRDSALVDVGLDTQINNALTAFVDYSVQAGQSNYFGQSVQAGFKIGF